MFFELKVIFRLVDATFLPPDHATRFEITGRPDTRRRPHTMPKASVCRPDPLPQISHGAAGPFEGGFEHGPYAYEMNSSSDPSGSRK